MIGTYLHGPLLPRNPWLADWLLAQALAHRTGEATQLEPLDDELEAEAHARVGGPRANARRPLLTAVTDCYLDRGPRERRR